VLTRREERAPNVASNVKRFDPSQYAPLLAELLDAVRDYTRQTAMLPRQAAWHRIRDARLAIVEAEDSLKAKANKLEGTLRKFDGVPEDQRPNGYVRGCANWLGLLETYESLWAGRRCIELLVPSAATMPDTEEAE